MAYKLIKMVILRGDYIPQKILDKLDAFLAFNRITIEQYNELAAMIIEMNGGHENEQK